MSCSYQAPGEMAQVLIRGVIYRGVIAKGVNVPGHIIYQGVIVPGVVSYIRVTARSCRFSYCS